MSSAAPPTRWLVAFFRPALLTGMAVCAALALGHFMRSFFPSWNLTVLVVGAVAASLSAAFTHHVFSTRNLFYTDRLRWRGVEVAMLFVSIKGVWLTEKTPAEAWAELQTWPLAPWQILLESESVLAFVLALGTLLAVTETLDDLRDLALSPRVLPLQNIAERMFFLGMGVLGLEGLARIGLLNLLASDRPPVLGLMMTVLVYFILGLILLSHAQYERQAMLWREVGLSLGGALTARWVRHTVFFVVLAGLVALGLPTFYGDGVLGVLGAVFYALSLSTWLVIGFIVKTLVGGVMWVISLFIPPQTNLGALPNLPPTPYFTPTPQPTPQPMQLPAEALAVWEAVRTALFWLVVAGVVLIIVRAFVRDRPELLTLWRGLRLRAWLKELWFTLGSWGRTARRALAESALAQAVRAWLTRAVPPPRLPRRPLSASEQIRYDYGRWLARAQQRGLGRAPQQTPREHLATLAPHLPEDMPNLEELTQAFEQARYAPQPPAPTLAARVRALVNTLRARLRRQ